MLEKIKENGKKIEILIFSWVGQPDLAESSDGRENLMINIAERMKAWGMNAELWEAEYRVEKEEVEHTSASWTQHSPKKNKTAIEVVCVKRELAAIWESVSDKFIPLDKAVKHFRK